MLEDGLTPHKFFLYHKILDLFDGFRPELVEDSEVSKEVNDCLELFFHGSPNQQVIVFGRQSCEAAVLCASYCRTAYFVLDQGSLSKATTRTYARDGSEPL